MALLGPREVRCPAGVAARILVTRAGGMPASWRVRFDPPGAATGTAVVRRSVLPLGIGLQPPEARPLAPEMMFERGWFDASHQVVVEPDHDVTAIIG